MTAVCVCGMHRSGTSLVSALLHKNGVEMGDEKQLEKGAQGNQKGFWENWDIVQLNDEVLRHHGGNWYSPPLFPDGWWTLEAFPSVLDKAKQLVSQYQRELWGWKDPRNSLTIPMWRYVIPGLKFIVCIRNPLNVIYSYQHTWMNFDRSLALWHSYNERIMLSTRPEERLIVHYESFFEEPEAEIVRMLNWIGVEEDMTRVMRSAEFIDPDLQHGQSSYLDLIRMVGTSQLGDHKFHSSTAIYDKMLKEFTDGHPSFPVV